MNNEELTREIEQIKKRNLSVEADKAWEISLARKFLVAIFTYLSISLYLLAVRIENPWLNAIVPSIAFLLSTATLPYFKKLWISKKIKK